MTGCGCDGAKCRLAAGDERHGSLNGYNNLKCRCPGCKGAYADWYVRYYSSVRKPVLAEHYSAHADYYRDRAQRRRAENPEWVREINRRSYRAHAEKRKESAQRYHRTRQGRAVHRAARHRRRDRECDRSCPCVTADTLQAVWSLDAGLCAYCGADGTDYEHVVPLARGGWGCVSNFRVACKSCNSRKGTKPLSVFLAQLAAEGISIRPGATNSGLPCPAAAARMAARMLPASPGSRE